MSDTSHIRDDLTRWNRAGLTRFDYVDGDASIWLEELRLAVMGLYMRGADAELRTPDTWRDLWLDEGDPDRRAALDIPTLADQVVWERLAPVVPKATETRGQRSERLVGQYAANPDGDYTWEIMRAFSRASHVLLGHLNAYSNEGYLRTATQWDNLRRLAALVNYQPTPPASASALVALTLKPDLGAVEVGAGLQMKYAPTDGGAPLIFETTDPLMAHPDLNAARLLGWNINLEPIRLNDAGLNWSFPEDTEVSAGAIVVFTDGQHGVAGTINTVSVDEDNATAVIEVASESDPITVKTGKAQLLTEAEDVRPGLPRPKTDEYELSLGESAGFQAGELVRVKDTGVNQVVKIRKVNGARIVIRISTELSGRVRLFPLSPLSEDDDGFFRTGTKARAKTSGDTTTLYYLDDNDVVRALNKQNADEGAFKEITAEDDANLVLGYEFRPSDGAEGKAYVESEEAKGLFARVVGRREVLIGNTASALKTVSFEGKPPKAMSEGAWFAAREEDGNDLVALQVAEVVTSVGRYDVVFHKSYAKAPEASEFHGPMKSPLRPEGFDRNPEPAIPGSNRTIVLENMSDEARSVLRPGRPFIFCDEFGDGTTDVQASVTEFTDLGDNTLQLTFEASEDTSHFIAGRMYIRLNALDITHGESKGPKTLGSGDGELGEQVFTLQVKDISHVPSTLSISGVVPDLTIAVDGQAWEYKDYTDAAAEGARAWSSSLGEDGYLRLHFRRRLPTGTSNVSLINHRVGVGARGNLVPSMAIAKPLKKHPFVDTVHQPFPTAGGADREPVASLRTSAPSRLSANGRAVSLADFERLAAGHASVWSALAQERATASTLRDVDIWVVPANDAALTEKLKEDLGTLIKAYAIPGIRLTFKSFGRVKLDMGATIRADLTSNDKSDILAAAQDKLVEVFSLEHRDFGQPVYVAEILAALETVPGITTVQATKFKHLSPGSGDTFQEPRRVAMRDGAVAAIYPEEHQIAYLEGDGTNLPIEVKGDDS